MYTFWSPLIKPLLEITKPKHIVEVGSEQGNNTKNLLEFCSENNGVLYAIDPSPKFEPNEWKKHYGDSFIFFNSLSLNALPQIKNYDAVLIDGDHNWYTVYHELKIIEKQCQKNKKQFPVVVLHDIDWPYGRRDLYYYPENIPDAYKKPYKNMGLKPGSLELLEKGGLNAHLNNSIYENDLQNGVLTAIEDFIEASDSNFQFYKIPGIYGLGVLFPGNHKNSEELNNFLNAFQPSIELEQYIRLIENMRINVEIDHAETKTALINQTENERIIKTEVEELKNELYETKHHNELLEQQKQDIEEAYIKEISRLKENHEIALEQQKQDLEQQKQDIEETYVKEISRVEEKYEAAQQLLLRKNLELERLIDLLDKAKDATEVLLNSKRWKTGDFIGKTQNKLLFRPEVPMPSEHLKQIIKEYENIRAYINLDRDEHYSLNKHSNQLNHLNYVVSPE